MSTSFVGKFQRATDVNLQSTVRFGVSAAFARIATEDFIRSSIQIEYDLANENYYT